MISYTANLINAISEARAAADDVTAGLAAQRRDHGGGCYSWIVAFDADPAAFMTVISDSDESAKSDEEIAAMIVGCWNVDWDDVQRHNPAGDFSHGSSDWRQR